MSDELAAAAAEEALAIPVEIRTTDSALVARGTVDAVDGTASGLKPGEYHIGVTLPSGEKIVKSVTLGATVAGGIGSVRGFVAEWPAMREHVEGRVSDALGAVVTTADAEDQAEMVLDGGARATLGAVPTAVRATAMLRTVGLIDGSGVRAKLATAKRVRTSGREVLVERPAGAAPVTVQVVDPNTPPFNIVVPPGASLRIGVDNDGERVISLSTGLATADDLLRLRGGQRLDEVTSMLASLGSAAVERHSALQLSGALVIAYGLLRSDDVDQMQVAAEHLLVARPDDPDVLAIGAEVWARRGRHVEALRCFLDALTYGLPAFSFGLNYCVERLKLYSVAKIAVEERQQMELDRLLARCREQYPIVQAFALKMDFEAPMTAYDGYDPADPLAPRPALNPGLLLTAGVAAATAAVLGLRSVARQRQDAKEGEAEAAG